jgi:hypothetical protein
LNFRSWGRRRSPTPWPIRARGQLDLPLEHHVVAELDVVASATSGPTTV